MCRKASASLGPSVSVVVSGSVSVSASLSVFGSVSVFASLSVFGSLSASVAVVGRVWLRYFALVVKGGARLRNCW